MTEAASHVVDAEKITHWFGSGATRSIALEDVTFRVSAGEIVTLTGPSGSGKTTLLTLIGGLRRPKEGQLDVLGIHPKTASSGGLIALRRRIGFIFQQHNLFAALTALDNVRLAAALGGDNGQDQEDPRDLLGRLGLGDRLGYKPHALSGGQRQRVAIARALVNRPKLILADEPTAALDADSGAFVMDLFDQLAAGPTKTAIIIVTHDKRLIDRATSVTRLFHGKLVAAS